MKTDEGIGGVGKTREEEDRYTGNRVRDRSSSP